MKVKADKDEKKRLDAEGKLMSVIKKCYDLEVRVGAEEKKRKDAEIKVRVLEL